MEQALYDRPEVYDALYASKDYESEVDFVIDRFDAHGNDGERALLVGCGTGRHSVFLRERGFEVTGVDPNPAMLDRARERSDGTFLSGGLPGLESSFEADQAFDLVWAPYTVLNYLEPDRLADALTSMTGVLADGGVLVLDVGDFPSMDGPTLQVPPAADRDCARLYQYRHGRGNRTRMNALVFFGEEWFTDTHTLTFFDEGTIADSLGELGYAAGTYGWYEGAPTTMPDPAVVVAH